MDINDIFKQVKSLTDNNKSESEKKTLTSLDFTPNSGGILGAAREGASRAYSVDADLARKYNKYGLAWNPRDYYNGNLDVQLADAQSNWAKLGNALAQTVVSEIGLGTLIAFSDVFDAIGQAVGLSDKDYSNPVTQKLEEWQEVFKNEVAPIYSRPGSGFENGTDFGWWMQNIPSVASSLTLLLPSNFIVGGISKAARLATKSTKIASKWSKLSQPTRAILSEGSKTALNAGMQRTLENYQEARQVYNQAVPEYKQELDKKIQDGSYGAFINNNADILKDVDTSNTLEVAKAIARESADRTFATDYANTGFDLLQLLAVRNIPFGAFVKNKKSVAGRRYDINSRKYAGKYKTKEELDEILNNRKRIDKVKDKFGDIGYYLGTQGLAQMSEGVEEAVNYIAQEEGLHLGKSILGIESKYNTFGERLAQYTKAPALWESAFWGWMGGIVFNVGASAGAKGQTAVKRKKLEKELNSKKNEKTGENTAFGTNKYNYLETADDYRIRTSIEARIADENDFATKMTNLNTKNEDPFIKGRIIDNDEEKEVLRQKLLQQRRHKLILNAMDSGTIDMLETYLTDKNVQQAMVNAGIIKQEDIAKIQSEDLAEIKRVKKQYNKYKNVVLKAAKNINEKDGVDIPLEYLQIIVRNNIENKLTLDNFEEMLHRFENEANDLRDTLGDKLDENIDYKSAIKLQWLGAKLGELEAEKRYILNNNDEKASIVGQERVRQLNNEIESVKDLIYNLNPENGVANLMLAIEGSYSTAMDDKGKFVEDLTNPELVSFRKAINENNKDYFKDIDERLVDISDAQMQQRNVAENRMVQALGVRSARSISKISKELGTAYATIAALEYNIASLNSKLKVSDNEILQESKDLHNYINEIRKYKIETSFDDIKTLASKYGSENIAKYINTYLHSPKNVSSIENITKEDSELLKTALDVLNLSAPINRNIEEDIYKVLEDYDNIVAAQGKNSSNIENQPITPKFSNVVNPSQNNQKTDTGENNEQGKNNNGQQSTKQSNSDNIKNSGLDVTNIGDEVSVSGKLASVGGIASYTYHSTDNPNNFTVTFNQADTDNYNHFNNPDLFVQEEGVSLIDDNWIVSKDPIIDRNGNVVEQGILSLNNQENNDKAEKRKIEDNEKKEQGKENANQSGILSTGDGEPTGATDADDVSDEEYNKKVLSINISKYTNDFLMDIASKENPVVDETTITQLRDSLVKLFNPENSDVINETIENEINNVILTAKDLEIYKPVGAAIDAALKASSISETDLDSKRIADAIFNKAIDDLIESNKDRLGFENVDGKTYINIETLLRFCNRVTNGKTAAEILYNSALNYLQQSNKYVIVDTNPKSILNNIELNIEQRNELEKVKEYSINFDGLVRNKLTGKDRKDTITEINNLNVGDTISYKKENNILVFYKNNVKIGYIPIPNTFKPGTDHLMQINDGWVTDINSRNDSDFKNLLISWIENPTKDESIAELYNIVLQYAFEKDKAKKEQLYNAFVKNKAYLQAIKDGYTNDSNAGIDEDRHLTRLDGLAKLWRYVKDVQYLDDDIDIKRRTEEDNILNRSFGIESWFTNMVKPSFDFAIKLGNKDAGELVVSDITEGDRIETSPEEAISPNKALGIRYKTTDGKIDTDKVKIGAVVMKNTFISGNVNVDDTSLLSRDMVGSGNTFVVLLGRNNSHEIIHAFPQKLNSINVSKNIEYLNKAIYDECTRLIENINSNTGDKTIQLQNLGNFLTDLFGTSNYSRKRNRWYNNYNGLFSPISGELVVNNRYNNTGELIGFDVFTTSPNTKDVEVYNIRLYDNNIQLTKTINNVSEITDINSLLNGIFNGNVSFNVGSRLIGIDNNLPSPNRFFYKNQENGNLVVEVGTFKREYKSFNDFMLNENLVTLSTRPSDDGYGNHNRFGENNGPIQTIKVKETASTNSKTPVGNRINTGVDNFTINAESIVDVINSKSANKGFAIAKLLRPDIKFNNFYSRLFPKNVIFVNENIGDLAYANTKNHPVKLNDSNGTIIPSGYIVIGKEWLDELVNSGIAGRKEAVRKLVHEQLHLKLSEPNNRHYVEDIREIFNEFARKNKDASVSKYLFNSTDEHKQRYYNSDGTINTEGLEEFLVESLTSGKLANALNNIEADNKEQHKTLFGKLIDFLVKLFDWSGVKDINRNSLYEEELVLINKLFGGTKQTNNRSEVTKPNVEESKLSVTFEDDLKEEQKASEPNNEENDNTTGKEINVNEQLEDFDEFDESSDVYSSDEFDDDNIPTSSIRETENENYTPVGDITTFVNTFPISQQESIINRINNAEISISC